MDKRIITPTYRGDFHFGSSTSDALTQRVDPAQTAVQLTSDQSNLGYSTLITFTDGGRWTATAWRRSRQQVWRRAPTV